MFDKTGEFPSPEHLEFALSPKAKRYYKRGPSFWQRYLPFWAATFVDRMIVMLVPAIALLFPLFKIVPPTYKWRVRRRIYRWYKDVKSIDIGLYHAKSAEKLAEYVSELDRIDAEVNKMSIPLAIGSSPTELTLK